MARQIWLISDQHHFHDNIYRFTYVDKEGIERRVRERFATMEEGDAYMIQRWADLVNPEDHVWCLGDLVMWVKNNRADAFVRLFSGLPGHKGLTLGNHDKLHTKHYIDAGFKKIYSSHRIDNLILSHIPLHENSIGPKLLGNVHGHIHEQEAPGPRYFNACVEKIGYEPVPIEVVQQRLREQQTS